jgi:hypothetical protein
MAEGHLTRAQDPKDAVANTPVIWTRHTVIQRQNCGNYLLRPVIGAVEMPKTERDPHKVGNSACLHLLHDRGPVMLGRPRADP